MTYYTVDHDIRYWVSDNTFGCYFSMYLGMSYGFVQMIIILCPNTNKF